MKKREGFHLLREVSKCFKYTETDELFFYLLNFSIFVSNAQPQFVNICFRFIPPSMRGKEGNADYQERLAKVGFLLYISGLVI